MITVVVVDISRVDLSRVELPDIMPVSLRDCYGSPRGRERVGAYMALSECYRALFGEAMPPIRYDEFGKPHLSCGVAISLSHRDAVAAVAFADKGEKLDKPHGIGVDIEWVMDKTRAEHIHSRYTSHQDFTKRGSRLSGSPEVVYLTASLDECGRLDRYGEALCCETVVIQGHGEAEPSAEDVTLLWTALEATLKASGGGFRDLARASDILPMAEIYSARGSIGNRNYALSLALYYGE